VTADRVSRIAVVAYLVGATVNVVTYFVTRDANYVVIALLLVVLVVNVKTCDGWRHAAESWRATAHILAGGEE